MLTHRTATILGNIPSDWDKDLLVNFLEKHQGGDWGDDEGEVAFRVLRSTNFTATGKLDFTDVAREIKKPYIEMGTRALFFHQGGNVKMER